MVLAYLKIIRHLYYCHAQTSVMVFMICNFEWVTFFNLCFNSIYKVVGIFKVDNFHCRSSLERLQLDQIGIGQLHWSTANYAPLQEQALWDGLVAMYEEVIMLTFKFNQIVSDMSSSYSDVCFCLDISSNVCIIFLKE